MHRSLPRHVFSVRSADTHFLNTDTDTVVQTLIQKLIHRSVLRHVFSVRSADTHSLNQRHPLSTTQLLYTLQRRISTTGIQKHSLSVCFWPCMLLAAIGCITAIQRFLSLSEQHTCL